MIKYKMQWVMILLTTLAAQCSLPQVFQAPIVEEKVLQLGVLGPFSGPSASVGKEFRASVTMALERANYQVGEYKLEPVWIDSESDPAKASQAYEQAVIQDKIQAGILNWHSSVAIACMEVTAQHKIPHFFGFGAADVVNETFASDRDKYGYWMNKAWPIPAIPGLAEGLNVQAI